MQFSILGSSSSGNAGLLLTENCKVLIDAGFSCKRLCGMLEERGVKPEEIDAIFVTHEHSDHTAGISTFAKRFGPKVFANPLTAKALQPKLKNKPNWALFQTGAQFEFRDLTVESFSIPHDAHDPVGFTFTSGRGDDLFSPIKRMAWVTDLGFAPRNIAQRIQDVDTLVVESNYDDQMLQDDTRRPWALKQRISGRHGHLSNSAAKDLLSSIERPRWNRVYLAHLSSDCNSSAAVDTTFAELRRTAPFQIETIHSGGGSALAAV
ncbi:MBL fold metallo-hydrolase [Pelagicoccus sp. NFK12]|uniref:MBL fold metallo-hydrolase n=1 Tax=Pelagicoccus enzymogenes TaxID=2773457 RepID=A0A927F470_9BACT|nr:MBL fold metallo-hydrolase [Pelagicoccus enzymogenes]MBD5778089.1 MBL fold metallo-hydrolase [Pelagicoccus enzymogenes]MDQ8198155.1 MBL fold metallo-hydrolase [Pelagicoccus enzymogenes]